MENFYCDNFYFVVSVDGIASGLFVLKTDAFAFYADMCEKQADQEIALWRLNGGYLCTPPVEMREAVEQP